MLQYNKDSSSDGVASGANLTAMPLHSALLPLRQRSQKMLLRGMLRCYASASGTQCLVLNLARGALHNSTLPRTALLMCYVASHSADTEPMEQSLG